MDCLYLSMPSHEKSRQRTGADDAAPATIDLHPRSLVVSQRGAIQHPLEEPREGGKPRPKTRRRKKLWCRSVAAPGECEPIRTWIPPVRIDGSSYNPGIYNLLEKQKMAACPPTTGAHPACFAARARTYARDTTRGRIIPVAATTGALAAT